MATDKRTGAGALEHLARLTARPEEHHVFQAIRVIEAAHPEAPRLGESRRPRQDRVRLGQEAELAFPPSTIRDFTPAKGDQPARLTNRFFGLFGPQGPLPLHLTGYARDRQRNHRDPTLVAFANMLTHRMMSLLYRAWRTGQPAASFDRGNDTVQEQVAALAGYRGRALRGRDAMPDVARYHFAAHLSQGAKNPDGLVAILSAFFGVPVRLQPFIGTWLHLEPDDCWRLGHPAGLGRTTSIGARVWSRASKFRLRLGPLGMDRFERLLPGTDGFRRLESIVRSYVGDGLDWEVQLVLAGDEVPRAVLGGQTRLGQTSWIGAGQGTERARPDAEDLMLTPRRAAG